MNIVILGANGKVGSKVATELLSRGHSVTACIHKNREHVPERATVATIDINDEQSVTEVFKNADAVVCALSSWAAPDHNVLSSAMRTVIPAMQKAGVKRIVSISGDVARVPAEKTPLFVRIFHTLVFGTPKKVILDSEGHIRQLYESDLEWSVLRPTVMTSSSNNKYRLQTKHPLAPFIPRVAVVASIADLIEQGSYIREAPYISSIR